MSDNGRIREANRIIIDNEGVFGVGIDSLIIADNEGVILARTHDPAMYGDIGLHIPHINAGMNGISSYFFFTSAFAPMGISITVPIWYDGEVIGVLTALTDMSTDNFVGFLSRAIDAEVTIFSGDTSVATTIRRDDGLRVVGTTVAPHIVDSVIGRGEIIALEVQLLGMYPFYAIYFPLHGWDGSIIGMIFIGVPIE